MTKLTFKLPLLTGALATTAVLCLVGGALAHQATTQTGKGAKPSATPVTPQVQPATPPAQPKSDPTGKGTSATTQTDPGQDTLVIDHMITDERTGIHKGRDFIFTQEDTVITGATGQYNEKTDILDCEGNIIMDDPKHHMTSDKVHMDHVDKKRKLRLATFTDHVVLVMKPETPANGDGGTPSAGGVHPAGNTSPATSAPPAGRPSSTNGAPPTGTAPSAENKQTPDEDREKRQEQKKHGGTATCDHLDYHYAAKFSVLTGHVVFTQRFKDKDGKEIERTLTCEHADYDSKADKLHLFQPVYYQDNQEQDLKTNADVFVGTKEGEETTEFMGPSIIHFPHQDADDDGDTKDSSTKKPDKTTKPPK